MICPFLFILMKLILFSTHLTPDFYEIRIRQLWTSFKQCPRWKNKQKTKHTGCLVVKEDCVNWKKCRVLKNTYRKESNMNHFKTRTSILFWRTPIPFHKCWWNNSTNYVILHIRYKYCCLKCLNKNIDNISVMMMCIVYSCCFEI